MTDKDPKDMTASELLRWAANGEEDDYGYDTVHGKLSCALVGPANVFINVFERDGMRSLDDKIDAELAQARADGISEGNNASLRLAVRVWAKYNGWPNFHDGEDFGAWLDRCTVPRPRFDSGEPVQSSDMEEIGTLATCRVYMDGSWDFDPDKLEDPTKPWEVQSGARNERVKRPAPEALGADGLPVKAGETVYPIDGEWLGTPLEVMGIESPSSVKVSLPSGKGWTMFSADRLTHERPVLGADGLPLKVGETVYYTSGDDFDPHEVEYISPHSLHLVTISVGKVSCVAVDPAHLTHTPPDTQERIDQDAAKDYDDCWDCEGRECDECPAEIDGKSPSQRYGVIECDKAMVCDLLRRQRELDARKGGAMSGCVVRVPHRVDEVIAKEYDMVPCSECRHSDEVPEGGVIVCDKLHRRVRRDGGNGPCPFGSRKGDS